MHAFKLETQRLWSIPLFRRILEECILLDLTDQLLSHLDLQDTLPSRNLLLLQHNSKVSILSDSVCLLQEAPSSDQLWKLQLKVTKFLCVHEYSKPAEVFAHVHPKHLRQHRNQSKI